MSHAHLTVVGSLNYDLVTFTSRVPEAGETIKANVFETHTGGKGFNEAIALARLLPATAKDKTHSVRLIGKVGKDPFGNELLDNLKREKVDISEITIEEEVKTGVATILVEENGENRILITAGANDKLKPTDAEFSRYFPKDKENEAHFVMLQNEFPYFVETINWLKANRPKYQIAYNPSPIKRIGGNYLKNVDLLIVNEIESKQILFSLIDEGQKEDIQQSEKKVDFKSKEEEVNFFRDIALKLADKINHDEHSLNLVIVTLGSLGVIYVTKKDSKPVAEFLGARKVPKESVVDTTGAGDTFFGSVVSQLSINRNDYHSAIKFATAASSLAIQKKGAGESIPTYDKVIEKLY